MSPTRSGVSEQRLALSDWTGALAETDGPQLIVAGPGTGKTEFLARRAAYLRTVRRVPPTDILALTFSRRAAADFGQRLARIRGEGAGGVVASTFHSLAYRLLERHVHDVPGWNRLPSILTGPEQVELVSELLESDPPRAWSRSLRPLLGSRTLALEVTDFILRSREMLLDPSALASRAEERPDWRRLPGFVRRYDAELAKRNRIDYGTLMTEAVRILESQPQDHGVPGHRYVLVDEYQDTTKAQAVLLRLLAGPDRNLTAAADPRQSIFGFRGASSSNVDRFADDYSTGDVARVRRWVLSVSLRTPAAILSAAERLVAGTDPVAGTAKVEPASHPGRVQIRVFDQESEEAEWIARRAAHMHAVDGIPYHRMAVLVRTKRRLLRELSRALDRRSVPHDRPDMRLVDHPAVRAFFDLARAARFCSDQAGLEDHPIRRVLLGHLFDIGIGPFRSLERTRRLAGHTWAEMLRTHVQSGTAAADLLDDSSWTDRTAIDGFWHAWTSLPQVRRLVADPDRGEFRAAWASLAQTLNRMAERAPTVTLADYIRLVESDDFEAGPLLSYRDPDEDRVALTTLHQAKGLEFDVVFIADVVERVLPDLTRHRTLLQIEQLDRPPGATPEGRRPTGAAEQRLAEETRLMYTGMTRARRFLAVTATTAGAGLETNQPSRFLDALQGPGAELVKTDRDEEDPVTLQEAETWLRRLLLDPSNPTPRRLAATTLLADHTLAGIRPPYEYAAVRREGADRGLVSHNLRLTPSGAENYEACPRRFALSRLLGIQGEDNPYLRFASLIRLVLAKTETAAGADGRLSTLDEAMATLEAVIADYDFGADNHREAWIDRAEGFLRSMYEGGVFAFGEVVALEHQVQMEMEGVVWHGRVDRVESGEDGHLRAVSYKTSRQPPSVKNAESSLQLGFYLLAGGADARLAHHGTLGTAEFRYPLAGSGRGNIRRFRPALTSEVRARLERIARLISEEDWTEIPGTECTRCEVKLVCPAWPEGQEAYRR